MPIDGIKRNLKIGVVELKYKFMFLVLVKPAKWEHPNGGKKPADYKSGANITKPTFVG
ncbi:hypothetical protein Riv7116_4000 [Rivularia sp. PCC 7116]|nr:hypothetical protein Riv7116_4000 [Rivularia sp. PCC 7116]